MYVYTKMSRKKRTQPIDLNAFQNAVITPPSKSVSNRASSIMTNNVPPTKLVPVKSFIEIMEEENEMIRQKIILKRKAEEEKKEKKRLKIEQKIEKKRIKRSIKEKNIRKEKFLFTTGLVDIGTKCIFRFNKDMFYESPRKDDY